jgi:parallel beta-helix repeat protein
MKFSNHTTISQNNISSAIRGIEMYYSDDNIITGNIFENNYEGISIVAESNNNEIYHNNFVNNTNAQIYIFRSQNALDNEFEGNYWSDYDGADNNQDGIGDTPYTIDAYNVDHYPLMGDFYGPWKADTGQLSVISNSTVSNLWLTYDILWGAGSSLHDLSFDVYGDAGTNGFCRVHIPVTLFNGTYRVLVNDSEVPYVLLPCSSNTDSYLYFTYAHSTNKVEIMPEFPTFLILPLFMITTLLVMIAHKRRHLT